MAESKGNPEDVIPGATPITDDVPDFGFESEKGSGSEKGERIRSRTRARKEAPSGPSALPKVGRNTALKSSLEKMYGTIAIGLSPFDMQCAMEVAKNASVCAEAWDNLARENEAVRRILEKLIAGSAWGGVLMAHTPIFMSIALHHGGDGVKEFAARMTGAGMQQSA